MSFQITEVTLQSSVAHNGTVTIEYPSGTAQADFTSTNASATGVVVVDDNVVYFEEDDDIELSYGGSNITLTNSSGHSWPAGAELTVQLGQATSDTVTVIAQAAEADLGGSLTGTTDGSLADISDVDIASAASDSANPTAAEIDTAVNAAIAEANLQIKELQTKVNSLLAKLRTAGIIDTA